MTALNPTERFYPHVRGAGCKYADQYRLRLEERIAALERSIAEVPHEIHCLAFENPAHERDCSCGIAEWKQAVLS